MQRDPPDEAAERVASTLCEIGTETVAPNIFHLVLVGNGRHCYVRVLAEQGFVEIYKVRKPSAYGEIGFCKGLEVGLQSYISVVRRGEAHDSKTLTCVVIRYEMYTSFVPSFSFCGVPTVHSR